jgi:hypothetical protein
MGELMDGRPPDTATDGVNDRCVIRPRRGIGQCAERHDVERHGAGSKRATELERLTRGRTGATADELRYDAHAIRVSVRRVELQSRVRERDVQLPERGRLDGPKIIGRQRCAQPIADDTNRRGCQTLEGEPGVNPSTAHIGRLTRRRTLSGDDQGGCETNQAPAAARFSVPL